MGKYITVVELTKEGKSDSDYMIKSPLDFVEIEVTDANKKVERMRVPTSMMAGHNGPGWGMR